MIKVLNGHSDAVRACGFSRDGNMIVTGAYDHRLMVSTRPAPPFPQSQGAVPPDTTAARAVTRGAPVQVFVRAEEGDWQRACQLHGHGRGVTSCTFSADGMVVISGAPLSAVRHELHDGTKLSTPSRKEPDACIRTAPRVVG